MADTKHSSVTSYVIVALILGVITYIEFALVEYPQAWLGSGWTLFWLVLLSVVKFVMVIMFFMHLKDDDRTYTGFFSSGMFISLATFVGLTAMFILPRAVSSTRPPVVVAETTLDSVPESLLDSVRTGGASRAPTQIAQTPRPTDRSITITAPSAANDASTYSVTAPRGAAEAATSAGEAAAEAAATEPAGESATGTSAEAGAAAGTAAGTEPAGTAAGTEPAGTEPAGTGGAAQPGGATGAQAAVEWDKAHGASVFNANCSACHQANGQGIPGAFPPLAKHIDDVYEVEGGPRYLIDAVLFGLQGPITVNGTPYNGVMPAWGHLPDGDIADALNHALTAWSDSPANFQPYVAADVEARRADSLSAAQVHDAREALGLD